MEHGGQLTHSCLSFVRCSGGPARWSPTSWWLSWPAKIRETRPPRTSACTAAWISPFSLSTSPLSDGGERPRLRDLSLLPPDEAPGALDFLRRWWPWPPLAPATRNEARINSRIQGRRGKGGEQCRLQESTVQAHRGQEGGVTPGVEAPPSLLICVVGNGSPVETPSISMKDYFTVHDPNRIIS
jgi:hypothetical protein